MSIILTKRNRHWSSQAFILLKDKTLNYGFIFHFSRKHQTFKLFRWCRIRKNFDRHGHNMIGLVAGYSPAHRVELSITPEFYLKTLSPNPCRCFISILKQVII